MSDFFHGWRRKTGCVLLVMAFVLAGLWTRSFYHADQLSYATGKHSVEKLHSGNGFAVWMSYDVVWDQRFPAIEWNWVYPKDAYFNDQGAANGSKMEWQFNWLCIGSGKVANNSNRVRFISYWSITIPLTLLSAYLLLWPGKRQERQVKAPVENK